MSEPEPQSSPSKPKARHFRPTLDHLVTGLAVVEGLLMLSPGHLGHGSLDPKTIQAILMVLGVVGCLFIVILVMRMLPIARRIRLRRGWSSYFVSIPAYYRSGT